MKFVVLCLDGRDDDVFMSVITAKDWDKAWEIVEDEYTTNSGGVTLFNKKRFENLKKAIKKVKL